MKGLTVMIEFCGPFQWKPGYFCSNFSSGYFKRVWWLWFAFAWVRIPLDKYNRYISSGNTEWKDGEGK